MDRPGPTGCGGRSKVQKVVHQVDVVAKSSAVVSKVVLRPAQDQVAEKGAGTLSSVFREAVLVVVFNSGVA